jgi:ATP-dependent 26S proteasome regulatory subunit
MAVKAYRTSLEHLLDELARIDLLVRAAVEQARRASGDDALRGLAISEAEVDALLERPLGQPPWAAAPMPPGLAAVGAALARRAKAIAARCRASARAGVPLRIAALAERFGLDRFDLDVLLLALAPELDLKYERLFAYLNDDVTRKRPTVDAAVGLLCPGFEARLAARRRFGPGAPLVRRGLVHVGAGPAERGASRLAAALAVDDRIAGFLLGTDDLDPRLAPFARLLAPRAPSASPEIPADLEAQLTRFVTDSARERGPGPVVYLEGPYGVGKRAMAEALARALGVPLLAVNAEALLAAGDEPVRAVPKLALREAALAGAAILWDGGGALLDDARPLARAALLEALEEHEGSAFVTGLGPWEPAGALHRRAFVRAVIPRPSAAAQAAIWAAELGDARAPDIDLEALTSTFSLTGGQIRDAAAAARSLARLRDPAVPVGQADLGAACRLQHHGELGGLARKVPATHGWDDLVLLADRKEQLRELCLRVRHRARVFDAWGMGRRLSQGKGLTALFSGPPGTGKTMAAGVIARELGLELFSIDLSMVVSKYIGETEKHLARLFAGAEASSAALFFDEADALFGKRTEVKDAHDRYANQEVSYLLQRIDAYEGVVILASNLSKNMDDAFLRRIGFVVEFPFPGPAERLRIWQGIYPPELPLGPDVDLALLAQRFDLSGGYIRNIALAAAFLAAEEGAAVGMRHLSHAARREFQKMGKVVDEAHFAFGGRRAG